MIHCVAGLNNGGYESLIMNLYRAIDRSKVQFDFITSFPGVFDQEVESMGGRLFRIPFITQKGPFVYRRELDRVLQAHSECRIVHSHMDKFSGLVMARAKKFDFPVRIAHSHATGNEGNFLFHLVKDYYGKMVLPNATHLFACGTDAAQWMFGEKAAQAHILKNGIDPDRFSSALAERAAVRNELEIPPDAPVFGHVGRFCPVKNHSFLLDIFAAVHKIDSKALLLMVGDGELRAEMEKKAADLGIAGAVRFLGLRQDIPRMLAAMDCFVFPSLREGLPVTLIEAQASGLPVLASSTITQEVCVTPLVQQMSLEAPAEEWANTAVSMALTGQKERSCPVQQLADAGYDIRRTAKELEEFYLGLYNAL